MPQIRIVIPCYNEAQRLDQPRLLRFAEDHRHVTLTMVDDGSRDQTLDMLRDLQHRSGGRIEVLFCGENRGKAEAVRMGLLHVLQYPSVAVGYLDADLSAGPECCLHLAEILQRNAHIDLVLGSRFPLVGRRIQRTRVRKILGRLFSATASLTLGIPLRDTQCGAKLLRPGPALQAALAEPFRSRWIFDVELIARVLSCGDVHQARQTIYEMPLDAWHDVPGSKLRPRDFAQAVVELTSIGWNYRRGHYKVRPEPQPAPLPRPIQCRDATDASTEVRNAA